MYRAHSNNNHDDTDCNEKRLTSPLHLSLSQVIKPFTTTPPVTLECHNKQQSPNKKLESGNIGTSEEPEEFEEKEFNNDEMPSLN